MRLMNPYTVLNIDRRASKREIIAAAALAMRKRDYSGQEIAAAQKELLDPVSKAVHDFIQFSDLSLGQPPLIQYHPTGPAKDGLPERLPVFDRKS